ncbi:hypothetical protein CDAR_478431 [Caerostris darwini]|uniref:Secreted protein n=1 Tax=Caerostris darwini TaxID=1538125 RepID=A0AAV4VE86_9ARAC|nr:hypothetical protein CDAR_478431 [Caerostris darwini]
MISISDSRQWDGTSIGRILLLLLLVHRVRVLPGKSRVFTSRRSPNMGTGKTNITRANHQKTSLPFVLALSPQQSLPPPPSADVEKRVKTTVIAPPPDDTPSAWQKKNFKKITRRGNHE